MENLIQTQEKVTKKADYAEYRRGLGLGVPIALGYLPVSFTFGLIAVRGGMPAWTAILISLTNFTSAGQFAGTNLILCGAPFYEIGLATFIINIRYSLMTLSLSQKLVDKMPILHKCLWGFGVTDETFTVASLEEGKLSTGFLLGLNSLPYLGWATGTVLGALSCAMLPLMLQNAMGIALYAMFMALIIPSCRKSVAALSVCGIAVLISSIANWAPFLKFVSEGWSIIIATIVACTLGAIFFPIKEMKDG